MTEPNDIVEPGVEETPEYLVVDDVVVEQPVEDEDLLTPEESAEVAGEVAAEEELDAAAQFEIEGEYYVDFTPAE